MEAFHEKVQTYFLRGIAALHSFWYEEALKEFRHSTKVDPNFIMGYWGEAMAYNHPLWEEQNKIAGQAIWSASRISCPDSQKR